ncbi:MAG TPA: hypothetical protein VI248_03895 [Kineosporiaceae bacterium]
MPSDLLAAFVRAVGTEGSAPHAERAGSDLLTRWAEPHRHYHTLTHLAGMLDALTTLLAGPGLVVADRGAVDLAAWFHDAIYTGRAGDDEEASAVLAEHVLAGLGQPPERVAEVARLVRLTARHDPPDGDAAGEVVCDADLAILAAPPERYEKYTQAVRREYAHVPDAAFRAGRAAVLRRLLATGPLFRTEPARRAWQEQAEANMIAELARLEITPPAG